MIVFDLDSMGCVLLRSLLFLAGALAFVGCGADSSGPVSGTDLGGVACNQSDWTVDPATHACSGHFSACQNGHTYGYSCFQGCKCTIDTTSGVLFPQELTSCPNLTTYADRAAFVSNACSWKIQAP